MVRLGRSLKSSWTNTPIRFYPIVLAVREGNACGGVELAGLVVGRIVGEIPQITERELRARGVRGVIKEVESREVRSNLDAVTPRDLGEDIVVVVGPLIEIAGSRSAEELEVPVAAEAAGVVDVVLRKSEGFLGIGGDLIPTPTCSVRPRLIQQCRREGVIPKMTEKASLICEWCQGSPNARALDNFVVSDGTQ